MVTTLALDPQHDHLVPLPPHWQYIDQFKPSSWAPHPSQYRCVAASAIMAAQVAYPNAFNPEQAEHAFYEKYAGPDVATDTQGIGKASLLDWFHSNHIGYIDLADIIDSGDTELLREEISAQNKQRVLQVISVADESHLKYAIGGAKLHNWNDVGLSHCFVRLGFSDDKGYGFYAEPAAAGFSYDEKGNWQPIPIAWSDILAGKITSCVAVMPAGVNTPPAGFRYHRGANLPDNVWPTPPAPTVDKAAVLSNLRAYRARADALRKEEDAFFSALMQLLGEI